MTAEQQQFANNKALNDTVLLLQRHGYSIAKYKEGDPLSLLVGDPVHITIDFVGPMPKNAKVVEKAKALLQFAKYGFTLTDHGGHVSIQHPGATVKVDQDVFAEIFGNIVATLHGFAISYKNGTITLVASQQCTDLTPAQAQELAEALTKASQLTPGNSP